MKNYRKRIADDILMRKLEGKGAVLIEGPKWCGKTTTAEQIAASILYMCTHWICCTRRYKRNYSFRYRTLYLADNEANEPV